MRSNPQYNQLLRAVPGVGKGGLDPLLPGVVNLCEGAGDFAGTLLPLCNLGVVRNTIMNERNTGARANPRRQATPPGGVTRG